MRKLFAAGARYVLLEFLPWYLVTVAGIMLLRDVRTAAGELVQNVPPITDWSQPLRDLGVAGVFIGYLIYDRWEEKKRKDRESERWKDMDDRFIALLETRTKADIEMTLALVELRKASEAMCAEIQRMVTITSTGADFRRRVTDVREKAGK